MKKTLILLSVAALAVFASCKKETTPDILEIRTAPTSVIPQEGTNDPLEITFKATKAWTVSADADFVSISPKSGEPAEECKIKFNVAANETIIDREFTITIKSEGVNPATVTLKQESLLHLIVPSEEYDIPAAGETFTLEVDANVSFDYEEYADTFTWQHITETEIGKKFEVKIDANTGYGPRQSYVKFTTSEIKDEEGNDFVVRVYFTQAGTATLAWQKSLTAYGNVATVGGVHRLLVGEDMLVLSDGSKFHMIDAANGNILDSQELVAPNAANDDAGNLIFADVTPYCGTLTLYYALADGSDPKVLLTYEHTSVYSSSLSNIRVKGDITGDALIVAFTDLYVYAVCWEIKAGVVQDPVLVALPTEANWDYWTGIVWNATRNGCVVPVSASLADGLLYIAYDGRYVLTHVAADGTATPIYSPYAVPAEEGGNENFNCISTTIWNGAYMVAFEQGQFFSYGTCPDVYLLNQATNKVDYINHALLGVETNYLGANDGENASSDVLLNVDANGNLEVYVVDALADVIYKVVVPKQ